MPFNASKLGSAREEFDWDYMDEVIHVVYNPQGFTPAMEHQITDAMEGKYKGDGLVDLLLTMLVSWDVTEYIDPENPATGEVPLGTSKEKLATLPFKFIGDCCSAITGEINKAIESGKDSGAGSPQTVQ